MLDITDVENKSGVPGISALGQEDLGKLINFLLPYLFGIAGLILLLYLLWGGFMLMTSQGDAKGVEAAKTKITHAIIGFVIIFIGYWLVQLLGLITGVGQIGDTFK